MSWSVFFQLLLERIVLVPRLLHSPLHQISGSSSADLLLICKSFPTEMMERYSHSGCAFLSIQGRCCLHPCQAVIWRTGRLDTVDSQLSLSLSNLIWIFRPHRPFLISCRLFTILCILIPRLWIRRWRWCWTHVTTCVLAERRVFLLACVSHGHLPK